MEVAGADDAPPLNRTTTDRVSSSSFGSYRYADIRLLSTRGRAEPANPISRKRRRELRRDEAPARDFENRQTGSRTRGPERIQQALRLMSRRPFHAQCDLHVTMCGINLDERRPATCNRLCAIPVVVTRQLGEDI